MGLIDVIKPFLGKISGRPGFEPGAAWSGSANTSHQFFLFSSQNQPQGLVDVGRDEQVLRHLLSLVFKPDPDIFRSAGSDDVDYFLSLFFKKR